MQGLRVDGLGEKAIRVYQGGELINDISLKLVEKSMEKILIA
jgi:hypothetical protein